MKLTIDDQFFKLLVRIWVIGPEVLAGDLLIEFDIDFERDTSEELQDEFFFLTESILDRWAFNTFGPDGRQKLMDRVEAIALNKYCQRYGRDEERIRRLLNDRRADWGEYSRLMTEEGPGGLLWHFSRHIISDVISEASISHHMKFYSYLSSRAQKIHALILVGLEKDDFISVAEWLRSDN